MKLLEKVAEMKLKRERDNDSSQKNGTYDVTQPAHLERRVSFPEETLAKAEGLGLGVAHVDQSRDYSVIFRAALHSLSDEEPELLLQKMRKAYQTFPKDIPEALKRHVELFAIHTFINSCGTYYFPNFVAEDFLIEDFPEPSGGMEIRGSELLTRLGLDKRRGLSRIRIEMALFRHGSDIIDRELGLDPVSYRLVCVPPDLYLRLGGPLGWGNQEVWTHFDGYELHPNGRMSALAGGDVRFGGIYDLVSIGRDYEAERVIARFAVVQRKRMALKDII